MKSGRCRVLSGQGQLDGVEGEVPHADPAEGEAPERLHAQPGRGQPGAGHQRHARADPPLLHHSLLPQVLQVRLLCPQVSAAYSQPTNAAGKER